MMMEETFKSKIKHTIQKIKDDLDGVDNIGWQVADAYIVIIKTDILFAGEDTAIDFISDERYKIRSKMTDVKVSDFINFISEVESML
jgi:hypothetical protein